MLDFRPPLDTPWMIAMVKLLMPLYMKLGLNDTTVSASPEALARFNTLKGKKALICPNHSFRHDPQVMFAFAKLVNEDFNFIAAREVFDWDHGLNGWWLQHMGCYSVVRGAVDRESFKTTRELLANGKKKLVLFPEGEISRQNDTLLPLESGAAQMSFWALSDIKKANPDETIYIVPIALKYTFPYDIGSNIRESLTKMENKLGLTAEHSGDGDIVKVEIESGEASVRDRLRRVADRLLTILEKEYKQKCDPALTMNERVEKLRRAILLKVAKQLDVEISPNQRELEQVRILRNNLDEYIYSEKAASSEYEKQIHDEHAASIKACYKDLDRAVNFIAIYDGYVTEHMSQERYSHVLDRLEQEVFGGAPIIRGARRVLIDVGEPINLEAYKAKKKEAVAHVTDEIFSQISSMLHGLESKRKKVFLK
ncbi:MAG: lysophospholipid acyltransferase family protein [Candidatus Melainabacteria bacterium]|nr:lysophospholipid acyltransferase family protein [Candidatus Melainabacteria bacterium]